MNGGEPPRTGRENMSQDNDALAYAQYADSTATSENALAELSRLADEQAQAAAQVADLEAQLDKARDRFRDISERIIPEKMDELGMEEFKTRTGLKIKIKEAIRASIPKARQGEAFRWLRDNGYAGLIKRNVAIKFGKGEDETAEELAKQLSEKFEVEDNTSVHPSTLKAFVNEQLSNGVEIPMELFGVHRQRVSVIA